MRIAVGVADSRPVPMATGHTCLHSFGQSAQVSTTPLMSFDSGRMMGSPSLRRGGGSVSPRAPGLTRIPTCPWSSRRGGTLARRGGGLASTTRSPSTGRMGTSIHSSDARRSKAQRRSGPAADRGAGNTRTAVPSANRLRWGSPRGSLPAASEYLPA